MKVLEINQKGVIYRYFFEFDKSSFTLVYKRNDEVLHMETITLNLEKDEETIRVYYLFSEFAEEIWLNSPTKQRVTFMRNFLIYALSVLNDIPIYRIIKDIHIEINGIKIERSVNSVIKNVYRNQKHYEEVLRLLLKHSPKIM